MLINVPRLRLHYRSTDPGAWCVCIYTAKGAWHSGWLGTSWQAISVAMAEGIPMMELITPAP
jgi:hypothetical protein